MAMPSMIAARGKRGLELGFDEGNMKREGEEKEERGDRGEREERGEIEERDEREEKERDGELEIEGKRIVDKDRKRVGESEGAIVEEKQGQGSGSGLFLNGLHKSVPSSSSFAAGQC
jgi:hypothetical protein